MNHYGRFWQRARKAKGWTQVELAERLGLMTAQFVSNVERGIARYPLIYMPKLIRLLKVEPQEVMDLILREEARRIRQELKKNCGTE